MKEVLKCVRVRCEKSEKAEIRRIKATYEISTFSLPFSWYCVQYFSGPFAYFIVLQQQQQEQRVATGQCNGGQSEGTPATFGLIVSSNDR
ncbi:hypothetical protein E2C01_023477 [Portunus trituberculatus]|uniref:Uncharacterized protein n=1 Tax=Portunus trituberculatus TaxID=210409 RepID=A0A5B7EA32_PORTR|nr:hypothetical protein [Portunus trituberculatus]